LRGAAAALLLVQSPMVRAVPAVPDAILLWPNGAPGSEGSHDAETVRINEHGEHIVSNVHAPTVIPFLPKKPTGIAVIVIPGGGHRELWMDHEGYSVARFVAAHGIAGFVLKYRLARAEGSTYSVEVDELADLQRALRLVRLRATEWHIDPERIGVIGFSAGGELAALAAARYDSGAPDATDPLERLGSRPAFQALIYPAIPRELQIPAQAPPAFLLCGADDQPAISQGLADLYLAFRRAGVAAELHVYAGVGHGFGLRPQNTGAAAAWPQEFLQWLEAVGMLRRP
jgi:endo-1,4-beta-xylanase